MKIILVEPFFAGSHATWTKGYQHFNQHDVEILSLSGEIGNGGYKEKIPF